MKFAVYVEVVRNPNYLSDYYKVFHYGEKQCLESKSFEDNEIEDSFIYNNSSDLMHLIGRFFY